MADIKSYALWIERVRSKEIGVVAYGWGESRTPTLASGGGGGRGKAHFDLVNLTLANGAANSEFAVATTSGTNLGRGRLEAVLPSGAKRVICEFDSTLVQSFSGAIRFPEHFQVELSVTNLRVLWK